MLRNADGASVDAPMRRRRLAVTMRTKGGVTMLSRYEYKVIDTSRDIERQLNDLGAEGWQVVGVTTKKQLLIAPPAAIILMRQVEAAAARAA
jgi:hypothetical protein